MSFLPPPNPNELIYVQRLTKRICDEIATKGGRINFANFMEIALYAPELGYYYNPGVAKFGESGDFITAPDISPLFASCLARQVAEILSEIPGEILEIGAGNGALACNLLQELDTLSRLPRSYTIFEASPELIQRQKKRVSQLPKLLAKKIQWIETLPVKFEGVVIGNEVLDAMPTQILYWHEDGIAERGVGWEAGKFCWSERPLEPGPLFNIARLLEIDAGYVSEISLAARYFVAALARRITRGVMIFIDYGFGRSELFHPDRSTGTLMCHYRHFAHDDPFYLPGLQDITSHVDFSTVAESGEAQGLELLGYTNQAQFLINCEIIKFLEDKRNDSDYPRIASQAQKLLSPSEMGELFKVIALGKGLSSDLIGFSQGDKRRML